MRIVGNPPSGGKKPTTPTIGTATDGGTGTTVSVAFTPSTYIGKGTITYTATSSPGSITGTGSGSPITVSGLTSGTAYTFTVNGTTNYGVASDSSAASNSVTPTLPSSFESISTVTGNGSATTLTFSSIPSTYKHLQIRGFGKQVWTTATVNPMYITFNSDTGTNYTLHRLWGDGSTAQAQGGVSQNQVQIYGILPTTASTLTNVQGAMIMDIIDYASTSKNKTVKVISGTDANISSTTYTLNLESYLWLNTSAISSITLSTIDGRAFTNTATFALYGIKG